MDLETLITFLLASFTLTISPGPDILYVISQSIIKGKKSAFMISLGLTTGLLVHTFLVAVGLSVIISQNENILNMIKLLSVFYFFYLIVMVFLILGLIFWLQATIIFLLVSVFSSKFASISNKKSFVNKNIYIIEISIYLFIIYWIVG